MEAFLTESHYIKKSCDGEMNHRIRTLMSLWHIADGVLRQTRVISRWYERSGFTLFML
jgi:hypothetical protein